MDNLKLLMKLGLTEYEARAYLSLAKLGPSTVREIVLDSHIPRNKAYEALQKLEQKNKIISIPISPKKFRINDPEVFKEEINDLNKSADALIKLIDQPKLVEFKDLFWVIKSKQAIMDKLANSTLKAKKEILGCNRLSRILYKNIRNMKDAVQRGVKIKLICEYDKTRKDVYKAWMKTGAEIRVFDKKQFGPLLPKISIIDQNISRLTIGRPEVKNDEDYISMWTESKAFSQMLRKHFLYMWKRSKPIQIYFDTKNIE